MRRISIFLLSAALLGPSLGAQTRVFTNTSDGIWLIRMDQVRNPGGMEVTSGGIGIGRLADPGDTLPLPARHPLVIRYLSSTDIRFALVSVRGGPAPVFQVGADLSLSPLPPVPEGLERVVRIPDLAEGRLTVIAPAWP